MLGPVESDVQLLRVGGMTCSACSGAVEAALRKLPGVQTAVVSLITGVAEVRYDPDATGPRHLIAAVEAAGFDAEPLSQQQLGERGRAGGVPGLAGVWRAQGAGPAGLLDRTEPCALRRPPRRVCGHQPP